jgi:hypothetical protein
MDFRITGIDPALYRDYFALDDRALARRFAQRRIVEAKPGAPCRVSLEDAEPGEEVLLVNHEHLPVDSPYRSRHAIYVRAAATRAYDRVNEVPPALATRLLAVRAFDARHMMIDCDLSEGPGIAPLIRRLLGLPGAAYLHVHFARAGCFAARVVRADSMSENGE